MERARDLSPRPLGLGITDAHDSRLLDLGRTCPRHECGRLDDARGPERKKDQVQVHYTRPLLAVVQGLANWLTIRARLATSITPAIEETWKWLLEEIQKQFNFDTSKDQTIDYVSKPIVYAPDEVEFQLDIESVDRLGREVLTDFVHLTASRWETRQRVAIVDLWVGGEAETLSKKERDLLKVAMKEVSSLPVEGKIFVLGEDVTGVRKAGAADMLMRSRGILQKQVTPACEYFITDSPELADAARKAGAKQVLSRLAVGVMARKLAG